jgi:2-polyprenyl-3-methyl-5-hydroxy-6-metoxy-1,4-benzoquinol methylase
MHDNNYFELRNISEQVYANYSLPPYLLEVLTDRASRVLDFGCGFGQVILSLNKVGFHDVDGADINSVVLKYLRELNINVYDLTAEKEFYSSHKGIYDFVIMNHVLEHIQKNEIIDQLKLIRGLIKAGGSLIVVVPNAQSSTGCYWAYEDFTHELLFTAGSLSYVLESAGFTDISFIDLDCTAGIKSKVLKFVRRFLLSLYRYNTIFWNKVTGSSYHGPSPQIFSYEIKALARV